MNGVTSIFLGTPPAAIPSLHSLHEIARVRSVITRPDRPRGRSGQPQPSPVKLAALDLGLPVVEPATPEELRTHVASLGPFDVGVVVAYGMIIPADVLEMSEHGFLNVHFSLLPRWRGAAPVQRAIAEGDTSTGVTLMKMDAGLDTGGIVSQIEVPIDERDTTDSLTERMAQEGAALLQSDLGGYLAGKLRVRAQSATGVSYAAKVQPEEARLDFGLDQQQLLAAIRAFNPKPGAFAMHGSDRLKIWKAEGRRLSSLGPGDLEVVSGELLVGTETRAIALIEVQPAGKRRMAGEEWARGRRGELGRLT